MNYRNADHTFAVCAYLESPYLEACVQSLFLQEIRTNIILCTSTPNLHIKRVADKYCLPLYIQETKEAGIAGDWNYALSCADTPLVTLAHQDDIYRKNYTKEILKAANICRHPLLIFSDYVELKNDQTVTTNRLLRVKRLLLMPLCLKSLWGKRCVRRGILSLGSAICCPSLTIVRNNVSKPVFEYNMKSNIDWQAWEKISRKNGEFAYIPHPLLKHRIHQDSETTKIIENKQRKEEDLIMYRKFWPDWIAKMIEHFYQNAEKSNHV